MLTSETVYWGRNGLRTHESPTDFGQKTSSLPWEVLDVKGATFCTNCFAMLGLGSRHMPATQIVNMSLFISK